MKKVISCFVMVMFFSSNLLWAADLNLEDINFPFNSAAVVDDLKQIPRLVEKLKLDPDLVVEVGGYTDSVGSTAYNKKLSIKRANAVKDLLVKYGISPERIVVNGYGKGQPRAKNTSEAGRFVNRRAVFSIYKVKDGKKDYYYKDNEQVKPFEIASRSSQANGTEEPEVCMAGTACTKEETAGAAGNAQPDLSDVLRRLDKIEETLRKTPQTTAPSGAQVPVPSSASVPERPLLREAEPSGGSGSLSIFDGDKGSLSVGLGGNDGYLSGSVEGKVFIPLTGSIALQGGVNGNVSDYLTEVQVDAGVVGKYESLQLGAFGSTKFAKLKGFSETGNLGQISVVGSYLLDRGSVGLFATKAVKSEDVIATEQHYEYSDLVTTETYLKVRDRFGVNFDYLLANGISFEGDLGLVRADNADASGNLKVGYPLTESLRLFAKGGYHDGLIKESNDFSALVGIEVGNWRQKPGERGTGRMRPMQVPDISYEIKQRTAVLKSAVNLSPVVSISASAVSGLPPLEVTFTGIARDPDGTVQGLAWDFGDGTKGSGETVTHTFAKSGVYLVTLTATDNKGDVGTANVQITVSENLLPTVSVSASTVSGGHPLTVSFTGNAVDADGKIGSLSWDFGDGSSGSGATVSHTFNKAGIYNVTLTATDDKGGKSSAAVQIFVKNETPVAYAGPDRADHFEYTFHFGTLKPFALDASKSYDPDGDPLSFQWRQLSGPAATLNDSGSPVASFSTTTKGVYTFQVAVSDGQGGMSTSSVTITVE